MTDKATELVLAAIDKQAQADELMANPLDATRTPGGQPMTRDELIEAMQSEYKAELSQPPSQGAGKRAWTAALTAIEQAGYIAMPKDDE